MHKRRILVVDGISAVSMARSMRPEFVVLDIGLPGLDGFQVAEQFRRDAGMAGVTLIAVTGRGCWARPPKRVAVVAEF